MSFLIVYRPLRHFRQGIVSAVALLSVGACSGSGGGATASAAYGIGGTVTGLEAGQSIVLQNNGRDDLRTSRNGSFQLVTPVSVGSAYAVTVMPPLGTSCTVTGGSGTARANVTGVAVACVTPPAFVGYSVGGVVSGLVGQGLVLELYGLNYTRPQVLGQLSIIRNADFQFAATIGSSGPNPQVADDIYPSLFHYSVVVHQQPQSPPQNCVAGALFSDFTVIANVADVSVVCGEFAYATNMSSGSILSFSVDASTGALTSVGPAVTIGRALSAVASSGDKRHLYLADGPSNDLSGFDIASRSGELTPIPGSPFATGTNPRAIALYRSTLFVANAGSNDVSVFRIDPSSGVPSLASPGRYQTGSGPSVIAIEPIGATFGNSPVAYIANSGSNDISAFWILGALGPEQALEAAAGAPFASGNSVSSLAFGNLVGGSILLAANATGADATISAFNIDPNTAALTTLAGFPFALPSCKFIAADRAGRFLYATAASQLFGYRIDEQTGALSALPQFPIVMGADSDSISIDATNQFLYVSGGGVAAVMGFTLDAATGAITPMPGSPFAIGSSPDSFGVF
jgi:6-phosphogluconolactonase (cycloisomerase 2 family)